MDYSTYAVHFVVRDYTQFWALRCNLWQCKDPVNPAKCRKLIKNQILDQNCPLLTSSDFFQVLFKANSIWQKIKIIPCNNILIKSHEGCVFWPTDHFFALKQVFRSLSITHGKRRESIKITRKTCIKELSTNKICNYINEKTALYITHFQQWVISRSVGGAWVGHFAALGLACCYPSTRTQDGWKVTKVFCTSKVTIHAKVYVAFYSEANHK